jgi:hypothetical protein
VQGHVVPDVDDRGHLGADVAGECAYPLKEARPADAAGEYDDVHVAILPRAVPRPAARGAVAPRRVFL